MPADSIIEDIVARHDFGGPNASLTRVETRALIASWRERGEALQAFARADKLRSLDPDAYDRLVGEIRASVATLTQADLAALSLRRGSTIPQWPSVEDAMSRIKVLVDPEVETDMAARDLIVVMRELGRVTAENVILKKALREIQARVMQLSVNDGLITSD